MGKQSYIYALKPYFMILLLLSATISLFAAFFATKITIALKPDFVLSLVPLDLVLGGSIVTLMVLVGLGELQLVFKTTSPLCYTL